MNLRRRKRAGAEVHTSAMNDIMFFLLLFFLIASTITNPNVVKLLLPRSDSGQSVSKKTITVSISKDLEYVVDKQTVPVDQLMPTIQRFQGSAQELTIVLYVDRTVAIENVVNVMDIANKLKIKLVLATEPKN
ncbi:MAG: biopolymer transporter ExbD [Sphingobacteriales bacterium]|jgi:biopolymer transport protein ExbD|nr:biopolymer transporter ExbD [Sphingobacteriales bacterium]